MNKDALLSLIELHLPAAQAGDHEAFGHIVTGCQGGITAIALAIVRDIQASEDIAQEAFLSAWQHLKRLRNPSSFLPWLRQITRNLARDHLRRRVTERRYDGDMDDILRVVADPSPDHPERMARQHEEEVVAELIDELPEETREILLIYYREGQSSKQVADLLGMRDAAVRKRLQRARDSLRSEMLGRLGEFARTTAPSAAFTALVLAGLSVSPSAAAAGFAMGGAAASKGLSKFLFGAGAAGKGASKLLFGAAGGILFALIAGLAGVLFGVRRYWITSTDAEEKRKLAWFAVAGCGSDDGEKTTNTTTDTAGAADASGGDEATTGGDATTDAGSDDTAGADTGGGDAATGPGNLAEVATAAGTFKTLLAAAKAAGLDTVLAGEGPFTVFAPTDDAFAKVDKAALRRTASDGT